MNKLVIALCALLLTFGAVASAECFEAGFAKSEIPYDTENISKYYVAGYNNDLHATGVLDPQYARAFYLSESDEEDGMLLLSVDCVALGAEDVGLIRSELSEFMTVHIMATHDHAGADTLGLWGKTASDGKDKSFMESLRACCVEAARQAYANRTDCDIWFGWAETDSSKRETVLEDMPRMLQDDTRMPYVYDTKLYSLRIVPRDADKRTIRLLNYAAHAESLDGDNTLLSADYPAYVAQYLDEAEQSDVMWFPGAIGGLIRTTFFKSDRVENCKYTGSLIARYALSIDNEVQLEPKLICETVEFEAVCENTLFLLMQALGVLNENATLTAEGMKIQTEMSYLAIGDVKILLIPGEIFPELVYGNSSSYKGHSPEKALPALTELFGEDLLVFGLADDEIGYIVPPENFLLNDKTPYIDRVRDAVGEDHYEETNSLGPDTAQAIYDAAVQLSEKIKNEEE